MMNPYLFILTACEMFAIPVEEFMNHRKRKSYLSIIRFAVCYELRQEGYSYPAIRKVMCYNEGSAVYAVRAVENWKTLPCYKSERNVLEKYELEIKKVKKCLVY